MIVESERSKTKAPLFGRLLDWPPPGARVYVGGRVPRAEPDLRRRAFPIILGAISGMNDTGLSLTINEIFASKDNSPRATCRVPMLFSSASCWKNVRRSRVEKMLNKSKRTGYSASQSATKKAAIFK